MTVAAQIDDGDVGVAVMRGSNGKVHRDSLAWGVVVYVRCVVRILHALAFPVGKGQTRRLP